jgi:hypothetical protein
MLCKRFLNCNPVVRYRACDTVNWRSTLSMTSRKNQLRPVESLTHIMDRKQQWLRSFYEYKLFKFKIFLKRSNIASTFKAKYHNGECVIATYF